MTASSLFANGFLGLSPVPSKIKVALACYAGLELAFYVAFRWWLVPRSNRLKRYPKAPTYRDYPSLSDRHRLLLRILERLEKQRQRRGGRPEEEDDEVVVSSLRDVVTAFLLKWFVRCNDVVKRDNDNKINKPNPRGATSNDERASICHEAGFAASTSSKERQVAYILSSSHGYSSTSSPCPPPSSVGTESSSEDGSSVQSSGSQNSNNIPRQLDAVRDADEAEDDGANSDERPEPWTLEGLDADHVNDLFSWAFFGTSMKDLQNESFMKDEAWLMRQELRKMHTIIRDHVGLRFDGDPSSANPSTPTHYRARQMTLEPVNALHRPLLVYAFVAMVQKCANLLLRVVGFRRVVSASTGLVGWYRPPRKTTVQCTESSLAPPLLFFHGIAPAGHAFYVPMVLRGLLSATTTSDENNQAVYLFENPNISCSLSTILWDRGVALTEPETVQGVQEILDETLGQQQARTTPLSLVGHSFGSVPLTWMLHSHFRSRIVSMLLIDPVTILLSEPDVMINFLYSTDVSKIRMLASSELGIQVYLRRHFAWYNAELWLQDVPGHVAMGVALSEHDEILNAPKVRDELERHGVLHLYWRHVGHANCVTSPSKWRQLRALMESATAKKQDGRMNFDQCKKNE